MQPFVVSYFVEKKVPEYLKTTENYENSYQNGLTRREPYTLPYSLTTKILI